MEFHLKAETLHLRYSLNQCVLVCGHEPSVNESVFVTVCAWLFGVIAGIQHVNQEVSLGWPNLSALFSFSNEEIMSLRCVPFMHTQPQISLSLSLSLSLSHTHT